MNHNQKCRIAVLNRTWFSSSIHTWKRTMMSRTCYTGTAHFSKQNTMSFNWMIRKHESYLSCYAMHTGQIPDATIINSLHWDLNSGLPTEPTRIVVWCRGSNLAPISATLKRVHRRLLRTFICTPQWDAHFNFSNKFLTSPEADSCRLLRQSEEEK